MAWKTMRVVPSRSERDALELMVRERDERIAIMEKQLADERHSSETISAVLQEVKSLHLHQTQQQMQEVDNLKKENSLMKEQVEALTRNLNAEDMLSEYASLLRSTLLLKNKKKDSFLAPHLAIHKVAKLLSQLDLVQRQCDEKVSRFRDELNTVVSNTIRTEAELMNKLSVLGNEKRIIEEMYNSQSEVMQHTVKGFEQALRDAQADYLHEHDPNMLESREEVESFGSDALVALKAAKRQLDNVAREKEALERELRSNEDTIDLLKEVNKANEKALRIILQSDKKSVHNVSSSQSQVRIDTSNALTRRFIMHGSTKNTANPVINFLSAFGNLSTIAKGVESKMVTNIVRTRALKSSTGAIETSDESDCHDLVQ